MRLHEGNDPAADVSCPEVGRGEANAPMQDEENEGGQGAAP